MPSRQQMCDLSAGRHGAGSPQRTDDVQSHRMADVSKAERPGRERGQKQPTGPAGEDQKIDSADPITASGD